MNIVSKKINGNQFMTVHDLLIDLRILDNVGTEMLWSRLPNSYLKYCLFRFISMWFISAGDSYNQRCDQALKGSSGITKIVDDVLIASKTYDKHKNDVLVILLQIWVLI